MPLCRNRIACATYDEVAGVVPEALGCSDLFWHGFRETEVYVDETISASRGFSGIPDALGYGGGGGLRDFGTGDCVVVR